MSWTHYTDAIIHQQIEMSGHCTCLVPAHPPSRLTLLSTDTNREIIVSVHRHFECNWTDQDSNLSPNPPLSVNSSWVNWTPLLLLTLKSCNNILLLLLLICPVLGWCRPCSRWWWWCCSSSSCPAWLQSSSTSTSSSSPLSRFSYDLPTFKSTRTCH